jgi:hypothetical protein
MRKCSSALRHARGSPAGPGCVRPSTSEPPYSSPGVIRNRVDCDRRRARSRGSSRRGPSAFDRRSLGGCVDRERAFPVSREHALQRVREPIAVGCPEPHRRESGPSPEKGSAAWGSGAKLEGSGGEPVLGGARVGIAVGERAVRVRPIYEPVRSSTWFGITSAVRVGPVREHRRRHTPARSARARPHRRDQSPAGPVASFTVELARGERRVLRSNGSDHPVAPR